MTDQVHRVAIIGCGRMGQYYAHVYSELPNTEIVAIAEYNDDRRRAVGERFGVKALYKDVSSLLDEVVPDIAAIITPTKWFKEAVIACAEAGVSGVSPNDDDATCADGGGPCPGTCATGEGCCRDSDCLGTRECTAPVPDNLGACVGDGHGGN